MDYILTLALIPLFMILLYFWWPEPTQFRAEKRDKHSYHAIKIHPCKNACECAKRAQGKRMLSSEFALLQLHECAKPQCNCTFEHFDDRRAGFDRRSFTTELHPILADKRRLNLGRRLTDVHNKSRDITTKIHKVTINKVELGGVVSKSSDP